jgi:hypothetical protein
MILRQTPTTKLSVQLVQIELPAECVAAFAEELREGGISAGLAFLGESTEDPDDLAVILLRNGEPPVSFAFSRDSMDTVERARVVAFDFLMHCQSLGE